MKNIFLVFLLLFCTGFVYANPHGIYEFEPGFYYILDYPVNIRSQPNLTGSVIGRLELHSRIEILESTNNHQIIDGVNQFWYRIKFENIEGYIWGGFIAVKAFIFDINGIKYHCYYRYSYTIYANYDWPPNQFYFGNVLPKDIFIYINDSRIISPLTEYYYIQNNVGAIESPNEYGVRGANRWTVRFRNVNNKVQMIIFGTTFTRIWDYYLIFEVRDNGEIELLQKLEGYRREFNDLIF